MVLVVALVCGVEAVLSASVGDECIVSAMTVMILLLVVSQIEQRAS